MSKAYNSPTARLLQSSRLFSLPRPLPAASLETPSSTGTYRASDSATLPYPTRQAITTPASSHSRGDWGLKRAIPGKTTRSSTPSIRVLGQDTADHITDFESAADHERSRAKWAEMGVPIVVRPRRQGVNEVQKNVSVYEDFLDNTDPDAAPVELRHRTRGRVQDRRSTMPTAVRPQRWKHNGPHIAAMQEGEFQRYVQRELCERREEWTEFLIDQFAREDLKKERDAAFADARHFGPIESAPAERQKDMVIREAEREASALLATAAASLDAEAEARAKEEGERLVAQARVKAQEYEEESRRAAAPFEARSILDRAEREATVERPKIEREGEADGERAAKIDKMLANAARDAYRVLGVDDPSAVQSVTTEDAYNLILEAEAAQRAAEEAKLEIQQQWEAARLLSLRPSGAALAARQKELRDDHVSNRLSSALTRHLSTFLDIPAVHTTSDQPPSFSQSLLQFSQSLNDRPGDSDNAPPTTHPAAGLSHIRTAAFLPNHPVWGPQAEPSPILARVLQARASSRQVLNQAELGVGGFVTRDSVTSNFQNRRDTSRPNDPAQQLDPDLVGGGKVWVNPKSAYVDESGRVHLSVERADREAVAVKTGDVEPILRARSGASMRLESIGLPEGPSRMRANYGTALPDFRRRAADAGRARSGVRGLDREVGGAGKDEESAMRKIAELSRGLPKEGP